MSTKTLVIGLDSFEPRLLRQWAATGDLPVLRRLLSSSFVAPVASPPCLYAGTVWPSFTTGVSPARHRRFFRRQAPRGGYLDEHFSPAQIAVAPFWKAIGEAGKRVAAIDVPHCQLIADLNGIHVVDWSSHEPEFEPMASPGVLDRHAPPAHLSCDAIERTVDGYHAFEQVLIDRIDRKVELTLDCLQQQSWDLFMTVFGEAHCVGHQCWHLHDAQHPRHDAALSGEVGDPVKFIYQGLDAAIGRIIDGAGPHTTTMVLASHGMGPLYGESVLLDQILRRLESESSVHGRSYGRLKQLFYKLPADVRALPIVHRARQRITPSLHNGMLVPDRMRRRCFAMPNNPHAGAIRINLIGRESAGRVRPGAEYRSLCEQIRDEMFQLFNPDTGNPVVREVIFVQDVYNGPFLDELPDVLVEWSRSEPVRALASKRIGVLPLPELRGRSGDHIGDGLLLAQDATVAAGLQKQPVSIMDFAPTFAARLGIHLEGLEGQTIGPLGTAVR